MPIRDSIVRKIRSLDYAYVVLVLGLVAMGWFNTQLLAQRRLLLRAVQENSPGLTGPKESQAGDALPAFQVPTAKGSVASLAYDGSKRHVRARSIETIGSNTSICAELTRPIA